jgi:hypothetical protein
MKLYLALPQQQTLAAFKGANEHGIPMLDERVGALFYTDLNHCITESIKQSEYLQVTAPLAAVVHVEFADDLFQSYIKAMQVAQVRSDESLDTPTLFLSGAACRSLNAQALFTASFHRLNVVRGSSSTNA